MSITEQDSATAEHGWAAVPRDPSVVLLGKEFLHEPKPLLVQDMLLPTLDPLVVKTQAYAKEKLSPQTYNHSMRVYHYATAILLQQFPDKAQDMSPSTLALTALLHDIGTTHDNLRTTRLSFEFFGGLLALDLVGKQLGAPQAQAEAVAEAIIRHQDLGTTGSITFLGQLIQLATIYDNMGGNPALVHAQTLEDVVRMYPRNGWSRCFAATIREENGLKPWAHTTALGEEDFPNGVLNNNLMAQFE
ncbi:urea hydro-lyase cyanamide [Grosmannia clavigera kw1407]|uniref:Urea hydro-lyase cyanamide n=1 Tax=Grosmannia clavigera (strain kw1407 / UAMH 11150) TaxID=655863 RepID=F0X8P7_GROCL|nr:urea hydro-lyase cyanamide [Grosmannia clavigera kw1407]EFX06010.1 urea hydro-lyase cyanamide [Grosmannia clavigera kw1407]